MLPEKTVKRHLIETLFIGIGGVIMGLLICGTCFNSLELGVVVSIYAGSLWVFLWKGNELLGDQVDKMYNWLEEPAKRFWIGLLALLVYTIPIGFIINYLFYVLYLDHEVSDLFDDRLMFSFILPIIITLFMSMLLSSREFLYSWRQSAINAEKFKNESLSSQYETLKNQVNPHFLFNSLNALTPLVYQDQDMAVKFIKKLSEVYRYVLDSKDHEVILLNEELDFVRSYVFMQKIRFGENLRVTINLPESHEVVVPPLSLQLLIENAIKHNIISDDHPLEIGLYLEEDYLIIRNNLQKKSVIGTSSKIGLSNIKARYEFLTNKVVEIVEDSSEFVVKLPIIKLVKNENTDHRR